MGPPSVGLLITRIMELVLAGAVSRWLPRADLYSYWMKSRVECLALMTNGFTVYIPGDYVVLAAGSFTDLR